MGPTTRRAYNTENLLIGQLWDAELFDAASSCLASELALPLDAPGGMPEYRVALAQSLLFKFYLEVTNGLQPELIDSRDKSVLSIRPRQVSTSHHVFERPLVNRRNGIDTVGQPVCHASGVQHVRFVESLFQNLTLLGHGRSYLH
jgi:xanthine dehydrogenase/oxidase